MCGKFTQMASWAEIVEYSQTFSASPNDVVLQRTPMRSCGVVHLGPNGERLVTPMNWGFTDRKPEGQRKVENMHARSETVDTKTTWRDAFRYRRGFTFAKSFNEGKEVMVFDEEGEPTGKTWVQQWTMKRKDGKPILIAVVYDVFDVGKGQEFEFAQVTVNANAEISRITDRMPALLEEDDIELWLGELRAPVEDVKELLRTREFNAAEWDIGPEDPNKKPPTPRKKRRSEIDRPDLFSKR
jgi:putative SOS response-associated peptidase YedK